MHTHTFTHTEILILIVNMIECLQNNDESIEKKNCRFD